MFVCMYIHAGNNQPKGRLVLGRIAYTFAVSKYVIVIKFSM